jgi:cytidylate kinase
VVFPDADFKFYLDADFDVRARRRYQELACKKKTLSLDEVKKDLETRDRKDMTRTVGALKKTPQTITVDTTDMSIKEVVRALVRYTRKAR